MPPHRTFIRYDEATGNTYETAEPQPRIHKSSAALWPFKSDALGVNPCQIAEAQETMRARGLAVDYTPDGQAVLTSEKQFREVAKVSGLFNGRDGYGVPDESGKMTKTGREPVKERENLKRQVDKELPAGESVDQMRSEIQSCAPPEIQFADPGDDD